MKTARSNHFHYISSSVLALVCLAAALVIPTNIFAAAGSPQNCTVGESCTVGEFLFDDNSAPIPGAACSVTSKYPDHTVFLNAVNLSGGDSDGWYYYEFTAPHTTGMYSTLISCTVSGDTLSIDKSFEVKEAGSGGSVDTNAIAEAVWSYSSRTISSFGSLISDIWSNTTRSLTSTPVSSDVATKEDTNQIRNLLEQIVNKPIIQDSIVDDSQPIGEKLKDTNVAAENLYVNNQFLITQSASLVSKSNPDTLDNLVKALGTSTDSGTNTLYGGANYIKKSWNWDQGDLLLKELSLIQKTVSNLKTSYTTADAKTLVTQSLALENIVGSSSDMLSGSSLFSKIKSTNDSVAILTAKESKVNNALTQFNKTKDSKSAVLALATLQTDVLSVNKIPNASLSLEKGDPKVENSITNNLLGLKGIIDSNLKFLSLGSGKTLINTWLEVGSIIFKTVATNPSSLISQDVSIKYYLPQEIKQGDVIKTDDGLTVKYDSEKDELYVEGVYTLAPNQTKTLSVETKDIWTINQAEIDSLRKQAVDLSKPLEKTSYYAQGVSLKTSIDSSLDQIEQLMVGVTTPQDKIQTYRQAEILEKGVKDNLSGMKNLVTQAGASTNLLGFVGGSQTIAVWGIIIIVAVAFIFLTIYMRALINKVNVVGINANHGNDVKEKEEPKPSHKTKLSLTKLIVIMFAASSISAGASGFLVSNIVSKNYQNEIKVLGDKTSKTESVVPSSLASPIAAIGGQDMVKVLVPYQIKINVYKDEGGKEISFVLNDSINAVRLTTNEKYTEVQVDDSKGWIDSNFIKDKNNIPDDTDITSGKIVVVNDTETGWLRVRDSGDLNGKEIAKINTGEKYNLVNSVNGWDQIVLQNGELGWVNAQYIGIYKL